MPPTPASEEVDQRRSYAWLSIGRQMVNGELCIKAVIVNLLVLVAWITVVMQEPICKRVVFIRSRTNSRPAWSCCDA